MDGKNLPTEIGLEIFYALDSLEDVLSLSATTRWLRNVWIANMDVIYWRMGPVNLEGNKYAQALQRSISGKAEIATGDWLKMYQRAKYVNSIVDQFGDIVVTRFNCKQILPETNQETKITPRSHGASRSSDPDRTSPFHPYLLPTLVSHTDGQGPLVRGYFPLLDETDFSPA